ncbi:hypothetical protein QBC42DRAFT_69016 [Cladorrhinum samala]|uniref:Extracellular membrane protein CFEM domain-containing protein n=1 Tax=Cladorrhinum samala TaxID=585594 RepID=A0AAV9H7B0_9PEZI|nr:hypothetical protein QBC42DRAFT_69016 [Cladorrhinum samala]
MGHHGISQFLFFTLFTALSAALSLSDFQLITSSAVPISCILAYNSQISGCVTRDFIRGNTCSSECVRGLQKIQSTLQAACGDASIQSTSVLGQVLLGNLVNVLCPIGGGGTRTTTTSTSSSRVLTSTSTGLQLTFTTVRPTASLTTSTTARAVTTSSSSSSSEEAPESTESTDIPKFIQSEASTTSTTRRSTTAAPAATTAPASGGGSPFDVTIQSNGALRRSEGAGWLVGVVVMGAMMLLR